MTTTTQRFAVAATLLALAGSAAAHTGHDTHGFFMGLAHPFGPDHLLAMVAVGAWSAAALRGAQRALGPLAFLLAMTLGAAAGAAGLALPGVDTAIAASVVLMGLLLLGMDRLPTTLGLGVVAGSAVLHGLAHGAELPVGANASAYAAGFLLVTALLHGVGLAAGAQLGTARRWTWRIAASLLGGAGLVLLLQA